MPRFSRRKRFISVSTIINSTTSIMDTRIERIDSWNIDNNIIEMAGQCIKDGGLVAFPTETVYGLGGDALNARSSERIYEAKGRPSDNPLIVHIADMGDLRKITDHIPDEAYKLADSFWPGPLTMIFAKSGLVPYKTTGGLDTVAVRFPSDPVARRFIGASGGFIAAPSANKSGRPSPVSWRHVVEDLDGRIDMILCGDDSLIGLESTIVDLTSDPPMILRPGAVTEEMLKPIIPGVITDPGIISADSGVHPKAPGMKYRHYAPKADMYIAEGPLEAVTETILANIGRERATGKRTGVICASERAGLYDADVVLDTGAGDDPDEAARRLYANLRTMDEMGVEVIYAEALPRSGIGRAYMNRLTKAAGGKILYSK